MQADGEWHHAEFNLYEMLRADEPASADYDVRHLVTGDWGWMGNPQGQTYHIDNFRIIPVISGADGVTFRWSGGDASGIGGACWALDQQPDTDPGRQAMVEGTEVTVPDPQDGTSYFHLRIVDGAGNWSDPAHYRALVDTQRPTVRLLSPEPGARACTSTVVYEVREAGIAGVDPATIKLTVNGEEYGVDNQGVTYDADTQQLTFSGERVSPNPLQLPDGQPVTAQLTALADFAGNQAALPPAVSYTMDYALDDEPPVITKVSCQTHRTLVTNTFEDGIGAWQPAQGGATVELSADDPASGQWCLKVTNPQATTNMGVIAVDEEFLASRYPIVSFDYKLGPEVKIDIVLQVEEELLPIRFTDSPAGAVGTVRAIRADNTWHHASVNLYSMLSRRQRGKLVVRRVMFMDRGEVNTPAGAAMWLDNFILGAVGKRSPAFRWAASDPTGITDYSYVLDDQPDTVPDEVGEGLATAYTARGVKSGEWYFHVRARDGAGHWSPTATYAILHISPRKHE